MLAQPATRASLFVASAAVQAFPKLRATHFFTSFCAAKVIHCVWSMRGENARFLHREPLGLSRSNARIDRRQQPGGMNGRQAKS